MGQLLPVRVDTAGLDKPVALFHMAASIVHVYIAEDADLMKISILDICVPDTVWLG